MVADTRVAIGFGAGSIDYFPPVGEVDPNYNPGGKGSPWSPEKEERLTRLQQQGVESHPGGNILNWLAYFAQANEYDTTAFVGLLSSENEPTSRGITDHLTRLGITDFARRASDVLPSASIIDRGLLPDGSPDDREVHGRPRRGDLAEHMSIDHIRAALSLGSAALRRIVGISSLKSIGVAYRIFGQIPEADLRYYNPGSEEFLKYPDDICALLPEVDIFSLNETEMRQLHDVSDDVPVEPLAEQTSKRVRGITVCTMGLAGVLVARDGYIHRQDVVPVPFEEVKSTLGTGDRAGAIAARHYAQDDSLETIAEAIVNGTTPVVRTLGAHSDLYS